MQWALVSRCVLFCLSFSCRLVVPCPLSLLFSLSFSPVLSSLSRLRIKGRPHKAHRSFGPIGQSATDPLARMGSWLHTLSTQTYFFRTN